MRSYVVPSFLALAVLGAISPAYAALTSYTVVQISPSAGAYTNSSTNGQSASVSYTNALGDVVGIVLDQPVASTGNISSSGQNAWYYNPVTGASTIVDMSNGFTPTPTGGSYLKSNGYAGATVRGMSNTGYVVGTNPIYFNGTQAGNDSYLYTPATTKSGVGTTVTIPLLNAPDVTGYGANNSHNQNVVGVTDSGTAVGSVSLQAAGTTLSIGTDAYVYTVGNSNSQLVTIAPAGGIAYQTTAGISSFSVTLVGTSGFAAGSATRYVNGSTAGSDAWVLNTANGNAQATTISPSVSTPLFGGATLTNDGTATGTTTSQVKAINGSGEVIGTSTRYISGTNAGSEAWVYDGASTSIIGLHDNAYVSNGRTYNTPTAISTNGIVSGTASNNSSIQDAWVYRPATSTTSAGTVRVGFVSANYIIASSGARSSSVSAMGSQGQLAGSNIRYVAGVYSGQDAWTVDATTVDPSNANSGLNATKMIGLNADTGFTAGYYQSGSVRSSNASFVNALGEVAGYSSRYNGGTSASYFAFGVVSIYSQDAFVYDPATGTNYAINPSTSADGYDAYSSISYLSDSGVAVGTFMKFNGSTPVGYDAFVWTLVNGTPNLVDLGTMTTNLSADGWASLANAISVDGDGDIIGYGVPTGYTGAVGYAGGSQAVFLDVPVNAAVPEPASLGLLAIGGLVLVNRRQSR